MKVGIQILYFKYVKYVKRALNDLVCVVKTHYFQGFIIHSQIFTCLTLQQGARFRSFRQVCSV